MDYQRLVDESRGRQGALEGSVSDAQNRYQLADPNSYNEATQRLEQATYDRGQNLLQPGIDRDRENLNVDLANRGIPFAGAADSDARNRLDESTRRQLSDLGLGAVAAGRQEHGRLADLTSRNRAQTTGEAFGLFGAGRGTHADLLGTGAQAEQQRAARSAEQQFAAQFAEQQRAARSGEQQFGAQFAEGRRGARSAEQQFGAQFGEQLRARELGERRQSYADQTTADQRQLSNLAQVLALAGVSSPQFQQNENSAIQSPDLLGATYNSHAARAQNKQNQQSGLLGLGKLGLSAYSAGLFSDRRLKKNIEYIGTLLSGLAYYSYQYIWGGDTQFGVMADEVVNIFPEAIGMRDGYLTVDYGRVS